jgi:hypothetical protein
VVLRKEKTMREALGELNDTHIASCRWWLRFQEKRSAKSAISYSMAESTPWMICSCTTGI